MLFRPRSIAVTHRVTLCTAQFSAGSLGAIRVVREIEACSLCADDSVCWLSSTNNCCRRARFSRKRSSRERRVLTNQPRKCRSQKKDCCVRPEEREYFGGSPGCPRNAYTERFVRTIKEPCLDYLVLLGKHRFARQSGSLWGIITAKETTKDSAIA